MQQSPSLDLPQLDEVAAILNMMVAFVARGSPAAELSDVLVAAAKANNLILSVRKIRLPNWPVSPPPFGLVPYEMLRNSPLTATQIAQRLPVPPPIVAPVPPPAPVQPAPAAAPEPAPPAKIETKSVKFEEADSDENTEGAENTIELVATRPLFTFADKETNPIVFVDADYVKAVKPDNLVAYIGDKYKNPCKVVSWKMSFRVFGASGKAWANMPKVEFKASKRPMESIETAMREAMVKDVKFDRLFIVVGVPTEKMCHALETFKSNGRRVKQFLDAYVWNEDELDKFKDESKSRFKVSGMRPVYMGHDDASQFA